MSQDKVAVFLFSISLMIFETNLAQAMGEIYIRKAEVANVAICKSGLIERLHTGGNVHGYFSSLTLACLKSPISAEWVLISGTDCDDHSDDPKLCFRGQAKAIPEFITNENFWDLSKQEAPFIMKYNLIKYGFGSNCEEIRQPINDSSASVNIAWLCKDLTLVDGTRDEQTYQSLAPNAFKTTPLITSSEEGLVPSHQSLLASEFANDFIVDSDRYNYSYELK